MTGSIGALSAGLLALALGAAPASAQDDPRALDAVNFFGAMCGRVETGWGAPVDHDKYEFVWLDQQDAASISKDLRDVVVWVVAAPQSAVRMVHYVTPGGICGVEVEEADAKTADQAFEALVQSAAKALSLPSVIRSDETSDGAHTRIWRLGEAGNGYDLGISVAIDRDWPPRIIMTMSEAPDPKPKKP